MTTTTPAVADLEQQIVWTRQAAAAAAARTADPSGWKAAVRELHAAGARPVLLARATGLSRARISQIIHEPN
ncbi:hypothetical protein [Cellulomonas soli]|uniref:Resolvase HTH domain-containing protein n=1 Tax=Cellulomonas soli TaxID=931535 RepID=A0A512PHI9_9CELL|nr:hypothetical protein [Cellulomonas soli]NYI59161.1 hypothetical protein [Cellulomonas soli]GEP70665.1 hypothetical protein CSO01_33800 [Cellulomonas soli]